MASYVDFCSLDGVKVILYLQLPDMIFFVCSAKHSAIVPQSVLYTCDEKQYTKKKSGTIDNVNHVKDCVNSLFLELYSIENYHRIIINTRNNNLTENSTYTVEMSRKMS